MHHLHLGTRFIIIQHHSPSFDDQLRRFAAFLFMPGFVPRVEEIKTTSHSAAVQEVFFVDLTDVYLEPHGLTPEVGGAYPELG